MLNEQVIPIDLGSGIDTKTDPKNVVAGKLLNLQDGVFTSIKQISKRNGHQAFSNQISGGGNLVSPKMVHSFNDELLCQDNGILYSWSPNLVAWVARGVYQSASVNRFIIDGHTPCNGVVDCAVFGKYVLYAWASIQNLSDTFNPLSTNGPSAYCSIVDSDTNAVVFGPFLLTQAGSPDGSETPEYVRCILLGGTTLSVIYGKYDIVSPHFYLAGRTFTIAGSSITINPEVILVTDNINGNIQFETEATASGGVISYSYSAHIHTFTVDTSLTITNVPVSEPYAGTSTPYASVDPINGNIWIFSDQATVSVYSSTLATVLSQQTFTANPHFIGAAPMAMSLSTTSQQLMLNTTDGVWTVIVPLAGWPQTLVPQSFQRQIYQGLPVPSPSITVVPISFISRPFKNGTTTYAIFTAFESLFAIQINPLAAPNQSQLVAARFAIGDYFGTQFLPPSSPVNVSFLSGQKFIFGYSLATQILSNPPTSPYFLDGVALNSAASTTIDFNDQNSYQAVNAGELAILNGSLPYAYDGQACTEWGFHSGPVILSATPTYALGGGLVNGKSYDYMAIYQWIDNQGNLHQSAPSNVIKSTLSGSTGGNPNNCFTVTVSSMLLSQKTNVGVAIYRSPAQDSGEANAFFLITDPAFPLVPVVDPVTHLPSITVSIIDGLSDSQIQSTPVPYTNPNNLTVIENTAAAPFMIMAAHNNRLWFASSENPNQVFYSKTFAPGNGLAPCDSLFVNFDPKLGKISALIEMDEKLVNFTNKGLFVISGDGANDIGTNSTLSFPQIVPSDVGCDNSKSVILTPNGVMFHSKNGIYILARSLQVSYLGMDVEKYNNNLITSAKFISGKSQIRFLYSNGTNLVYDYIFNQWSTFTNPLGLSSTIWNNVYVYAASAGSILYETPGSYLDNGVKFPLTLQTSWLALATIQGFQRVRRLGFLGDYANGSSPLHGVQVTASYDFNSFPIAPNIGAIKYLFGTASSSGPVQYRERLAQQKCDSISLLIEEVVTGDSAEYIDITDLAFEAAVKKGIRKMAQSVTVT